MNTFKSQGLKTFVIFDNKHCHGLFSPQGFDFRKDIKRAKITIWIKQEIEIPTVFWLFAHEFFHWRQYHKLKERGRYSEMKADRWANKMTKKWQPLYFQKQYFPNRFKRAVI